MGFITIFFPLIPVLVTLFGFFKKQRFFFLLGYALYSVMVVPAELISYFSDNGFSHLVVSTLWTAQLVLAFPNKLNYDGSKVFKYFEIKTFLALSVINVIGIFVVLNDTVVNDICVSFHALLAFLSLVVIYSIITNKLPVQENNELS